METYESQEFPEGGLVRRPDPYRYDINLLRELAEITPDPVSPIGAYWEIVKKRVEEAAKARAKLAIDPVVKP